MQQNYKIRNRVFLLIWFNSAPCKSTHHQHGGIFDDFQMVSKLANLSHGQKVKRGNLTGRWTQGGGKRLVWTRLSQGPKQGIL